VVPGGGGDLPDAAGLAMPGGYVGQVGVGPGGCGWPGRGAEQAGLAAQAGDQAAQGGGGADRYPDRGHRVGEVAGRYHRVRQASLGHDRQPGGDVRYRAQAAVQAQLADAGDRREPVGGHLTAGGEQGEGERHVQAGVAGR
jgi:hypothetical protein